MFDDIQDRSPQRNHRPTVWGVWGVDQALNAGLALSCYARLALHGMAEQGVSPEIVLEVHKLLERTVVDLCMGQYLDLRYKDEIPTLEQYLEMVRLKTGVLLGAACEVGALVAGTADSRVPARCFGEALGVAFQLQDDILGTWGDPAVTGKPADDPKDGKGGLPLLVRAWPEVPNDDARTAIDLMMLRWTRRAQSFLTEMRLTSGGKETFDQLTRALASRKA